MPDFRYRALTQTGEVVSGVISASTAAEVEGRIDYLRMVPIDLVLEDTTNRAAKIDLIFRQRARSEDVTTFTRDLGLLLKSGARLHDALELLISDTDMGRLRGTVSKIRSRILAGENLGDALAQHATLFPPLYVALVRVGEASGTLPHILDLLFRERTREEALRRKVADALRYPTIVFFAANCVLVFFLTFVLPQFGTLLRDFGAKIDPVAGIFLRISEFMIAYKDLIGATIILLLISGIYLARRAEMRKSIFRHLARLPLIGAIFRFHRAALFCRNLGVLLAAGVPLITALRILADIMSATGDAAAWSQVVEQVRQGGKLSDALRQADGLPMMAVRMLRLGEETGKLPTLAGDVADFYQTKLQHTLDRAVALVGPLSIVTIGIIVGGLIASVMNSLLSISQLVG